MISIDRLHIRCAAAEEVRQCQHIAYEHRDVLPFVRLPQLRERVAKRELFVAVLESKIVGFVSWHHRRDGWHTIYDLAVSKAAQRVGIGRSLLHSVPTPLRLKVTGDNAQAVRFYEQAGMLCTSEEVSRSGRALYVYEMHVWN